MGVRVQRPGSKRSDSGDDSSEEEAKRRALEGLMDWFTAQLVAMGGTTEEEEEDNFVAMGRAILHTQAASVSFAASVQEMHRDVWGLVERAPYLVEGGGGVLFVSPRFTNYEAFDDFSLLVRAGLRGLVNTRLYVQAYHPLHPSMTRRAPVAAMHIFLDDEDLFVESSGSIDMLRSG